MWVLITDDTVAIFFWIISISMVAATVFFLMEALSSEMRWKTSMHVGVLVTLVAAVHYFYMRDFRIQINGSPILFRYIDWSIVVLLQMVEISLILTATNPNLLRHVLAADGRHRSDVDVRVFRTAAGTIS